MQLTEREQEILQTIVQEYIASAEPVGSRTVAKHSRLRLSPASMRNIMADLTEKGYLEQPHTSAGRIPSDIAFRFYVDSLLKLDPLSEQEQQAIASFLSRAGLELSDILRQASKLLSSFSQQVSMVLAPQQGVARWHQIDFILVRAGLVMAIMVFQGGLVQNKLVEVDKATSPDDLIRFSNYLNETFRGHTLSQVRRAVLREIRHTRRRFNALYRKAYSLMHQTLRTEGQPELFVDGTLHILNQPEFADMASMRELLEILEERSRLLELLDKVSTRQGATVVLGKELDWGEHKPWSMISSPYHSEDSTLGVVGIFGPMRMDYAKVLPVVDFTARILSQMLKNRFE